MTAVAGNPGVRALSLALECFRDPARHGGLLQSYRPAQADAHVLIRIAGGAPAGEVLGASLGPRDAEQAREACRFMVDQVMLRHDADAYAVLGLERQASQDQIKEHYRLLIRLFHPDREGNTDNWRDTYASRVNNAYNLLRDEDSRRAYDGQLAMSAAATSSRPAGSQATAAPVYTSAHAHRGRYHPGQELAGAHGGVRHGKYLPMLVLGFVALLAALFVVSVYLNNRGSMSPGYSPVVKPGQAEPEQPGPLSAGDGPGNGQARDAGASDLQGDDMQYLARLAESIVVSARSDEPASARAPVQLATPQPKSPAAAAKPGGVAQDKPSASSPVMARTDRAAQDVIARQGEPVALASSPAPAATPAAVAPAAIRQPEAVRQELTESVQGAASSTTQAPPPEPAGLSIQALNQVFSGFANAYERGELGALMGLFATNARADVGGYAQIRQDYEQLFNSTELRRLDIGAIHWTISDSVYRGWAPYRASVVRKEAGKVSRFKGRLTIEVREFNRKPLITELLYTSNEAP